MFNIKPETEAGFTGISLDFFWMKDHRFQKKIIRKRKMLKHFRNQIYCCYLLKQLFDKKNPLLLGKVSIMFWIDRLKNPENLVSFSAFNHFI